jgi:hypothetical protein
VLFPTAPSGKPGFTPAGRLALFLLFAKHVHTAETDGALYTYSVKKPSPSPELTPRGRWRTLRRMNRSVHVVACVSLCLIGLAVNGCVTAHEAQAKIEILDNANHHKIDDCILLTIRMESDESQGHWWVVQEETSGHMIPTEARVETISTGGVIDQKGKVMVTAGPYVKGRVMGVEYWLYRPGYQPDDFLSDHVERAYEDKTPLDIHLLPEDAGSSLSDEKVLDGARRVLEIQNFLEPCNPDVTRLVSLLIEQVQHVKDHSYKPKWQKQSREMLPKLREMLARFPRVEVTWRDLPKKPAAPVEPPADSHAAAQIAPPVPPVSQNPPADKAPVKPPIKTLIEERETSAAASDLPGAIHPPTAEEAEEEEPAPELIPVDLSELDQPSAETQPADDSDDDTVQHDLTPIHKD